MYAVMYHVDVNTQVPPDASVTFRSVEVLEIARDV
jgi:hypothetical protein